MSANNPNPEERRRMVDDTIKKVFDPESAPTPEQVLILRAQAVCDCVTRAVLPVLQAACQARRFDAAATQKLVMGAYIDEFKSWSHDEAMFLLVLMHTEAAMQKIVENERAGLYDF